MWIMTTGGFVSAVEHRDDPNYTMVRARDKKSLEEMLSGVQKSFEEAGHTEEKITGAMEGMPIYAVPGDYKWRVIMPKTAFACFLVYETMNYLNYSNYKSKLTATRGDKWHDAAMKVWSAMHSITDTQKTGNDEVDNPKPYSYYHEGKGTGKYPASKKAGSVGSELLDDWTDRENPTEGTAEGQLWGQGSGYYDADANWDSPVGTYWGAELGIDEADPDSVEIVSSGTNGYHTFSGKDFGIDGRGEIVDGKFIGASFLEGGLGNEPTDRELEELELQENEAWEPWDEETEFNTITGETRSKVTEAAMGRHGVLGMTDAEFVAYEKEVL